MMPRQNMQYQTKETAQAAQTSQTTPACISPGTLEGLPLAMVYAPVERFENLYELPEALKNGTLFADLDKPFHPGFRL